MPTCHDPTVAEGDSVRAVELNLSFSRCQRRRYSENRCTNRRLVRPGSQMTVCGQASQRARTSALLRLKLADQKTSLTISLALWVASPPQHRHVTVTDENDGGSSGETRQAAYPRTKESNFSNRNSAIWDRPHSSAETSKLTQLAHRRSLFGANQLDSVLS